MSNIFWKPDRVLTYNAYITMLVGPRGVGKTVSITRKMIRDFIKHGKQFVYIRRRVTELDDVNKFFEDMEFLDFFPDNVLTVETDQKGATFKIDGKVAGWARALSVQHYLKSVPFPQVYNIMFDEFIVDAGGNKNYLQNEITDFLEMLQSVGRMRDLNVYMLSNALSIGNPYFTYFDVQLDYNEVIKIVKRVDTVGHDEYGRPLIIVENIKNEPYMNELENSLFGQLVKGTPYGDYAINNTFLRDQTKFIKKRSAESSCQYSIYFDGVTFGMWIDYETGEIFIDNKKFDPNTQRAVIQSNDHDPTRLYVGRNHHRIKDIKDAYMNSRLWFSSEQCFGQFKEVLRLIGC